MGVKTIFKSIIGTMTIIIVSFFVMEYYNISVAAPQLKTMTQVALRQSCQYFAQESYKNGSGNGYQLVGSNGFADPSLNGIFYHGNTEAVYNSLYKNSSEFSSYYNLMTNTLGNKLWRNLGLLGHSMGKSCPFSLRAGEETLGKYYLDDMLTPLNIGVIYLDKKTINNIFRWELVNILKNGVDEMIVPSDNPTNDSGAYVLFKGFRIYYNTIKVTNIKYKVYDLLSETSANEFNKLTNIDVENYIAHSKISGNDERRYVAVATLDYSMNVGYEGITPVKKAFEWAFNRETKTLQKDDNAESIEKVRGRNESSWNASNGSSSLNEIGVRNEEFVKKVDLANNFNNTNGEGYNLDNTIIYYIIR